MSAQLLIPWFKWEPIVVDLGSRHVTVFPFQIMVGVAVVVVLGIAVLFARKHARSVEMTLDFAVHILLLAFPVSYLLNGILYEPDTFLQVVRNPSEAFDTRLGWTMYGGIIGGIVGSWVWKWRRKGPILETADAFAFAAPFGWCIGRIGCFGVHDHPGRVSDFVLAVANYHVGEPPYLPRHDLGLYDAIALAAIGFAFIALGRKPRKPGFYVGLLPLAYTPARFFLDFLRAPASEGGDIRYGGLTPSQYVSIALVLAGVVVMRRVRASSEPPR
jgi:phosphatidylglycerol:prolipoprotein diacylglycerol transferase